MTARLFSQAKRKFLIAVALSVMLSGVQLVHAQTFNGGSDETDGALNLTTPGTYDFYPGNTQIFPTPVDPDGDNVFHFTTITIGQGVILRLSAKFLTGPPFWLASGAVQIDGMIELNGEDGYKRADVINTPSVRRPSIPGTGGYPGGVGALSTALPQPGSGPGGGTSAQNQGGSGGGHAGHVGVGPNNPPQFGRPYGNDFLVPLIGGSGGGGGGRSSDILGSGGGAGGRALLLASSASISVNGTITANGGAGTSFIDGGGGGGSGGAVRLAAPTISGTGSLSAQGGGPGGSAGSSGRIRLEAFQQNFTGTASAAVIARATPFAAFVPTNQPTVRVVRIDGQSVPTNPTGSFTVPDVSINKATAVTVEIQARNILPTTVVKLHIFSETGQDQIVDSSPLAGTLAQSVATASVVLPSGFSRGFVRATWTPAP